MGPSDVSTWFPLQFDMYACCLAGPLGGFCVLGAFPCVLTIPGTSSAIFALFPMLWISIRAVDPGDLDMGMLPFTSGL